MAENSVFSKQMANREVCDMVFVDYKTKKPFLVVDYANTSSKELTGETVYAFGGKGHPKKVSFSGDKSGTLTIETQIQTPKLWELITGGTKTTSTDVMKHVKVPVTSKTTVTLGTGVEIANQNSVWVYDSSDKNLNTQVTVESVAKNVITVTSTEATEVDVFYITNVENVYNLNLSYRDKSRDIRNNYDDRIQEVVESNKERDELILAIANGNKELLGDKIDQKFDKYVNLDGIPENEVDEFESMCQAYFRLKGNHNRKRKYDHVKNRMKIIPVKTNLVLDE